MGEAPAARHACTRIVSPPRTKPLATSLGPRAAPAVTTVPGPPARVELTAGADQSAPAGRKVRVRPSVRVLDARGNPVAGVPVRFEVAEGGGQVADGVTVTDAQGQAMSGPWTLGAQGRNALRAVVAGVAEPAPVVATAR